MRKEFFLLMAGIAAVVSIGCGGKGGGDDRAATATQSKGTPQAAISLKSPAFNDGQSIPAKFTCDGENVSPALEWGQLPQGTQSLALLVDDPDAPSGTFVHWVYYDLSPDLRGLPEGVSNTEEPSTGGTQGKNSAGQTGYMGPCPPSGTHHYVFRLFALDAKLDAAASLTEKQVLEATAGHILATAQLTGLYGRE